MATTYLTRTGTTPTTSNKYTFSCWIKRGSIGTTETLFRSYSDGSNSAQIIFDSDDTFAFQDIVGGTTVTNLKPSNLFRDTGAWMNIIVQVDYTQAAAADRAKIFINGGEVSYSATTRQSQNGASNLNTAANNAIGSNRSNSSHYFTGSMSQVNFIDGTAYPATAFGSVNATSGIWKANSSPTVTYGNNGFFLDMANSSDMGNDVSGKANDFTVGGGILTQMEDTPDNNFATLNPLNNTQGATFSNGNTKSVNVQNDKYYTSTLAMPSGKYYWEVKPTTIGNRNAVGICSVDKNFNSTSFSGSNYGVILFGFSTMETNGTHTGTVPTFANNNIVCYAFDSSTNILYYSLNANLNTASANKFTLAADDYIIVCQEPGGSVGTNEFNFGNGYFGTTAVASAGTNASSNGIFEYNVPTGYTALSTKGLNL